MALTFKTIVAAAELDDDLVNAILESAVSLAEAFDANLHVVDVVTPMKDFETPHAMDALDHDLEAHHKIGEQRLDQLSERLLKALPEWLGRREEQLQNLSARLSPNLLLKDASHQKKPRPGHHVG